jgi:hypothetical protein
MRRLIRTLDEIQPADSPFVGGKAFNCAPPKAVRHSRAGRGCPDDRSDGDVV